MRRKVTEVRLGDGRVRVKVTLADSVETEPGSAEARARQYALLRMVADEPALSACGPEPFQKMSVRHDGASWVAEFEAEVTAEEGR